MSGETKQVVITTVIDEHAVAHSERITVSLPSPANYIYETRLKHCRMISRVSKKSVQNKCAFSLNTFYVEEKSKALKLFSWEWVITTVSYSLENMTGTQCRTKLGQGSVIQAILISPTQIMLEARLNLVSVILHDEIIQLDQTAAKIEELDLELNDNNYAQDSVPFVQGVGTVQIEIE